jgi:hypothetical protein
LDRQRQKNHEKSAHLLRWRTEGGSSRSRWQGQYSGKLLPFACTRTSFVPTVCSHRIRRRAARNQSTSG